MIRKYRCPKVKIGDWVYIRDLCNEYDGICKYKVLAVCEGGEIIVEVKDNKEDSDVIFGWSTDNKLSVKMQYNLPSGTKAWFVSFWEKAGGKCLNIE